MQQHEARLKKQSSLNILKQNKAMENPSSKQKNGKQVKRLAISGTVIPFDYDNSTIGFNAWAAYVRNEVHVNCKPFDAYQIVPEARKILTYYKPALNARKL
jgi:hypothetical protein